MITGGAYGSKAVSVEDMDNFLDWLVDAGEGKDAEDLYRTVAWVFWCVNRRANAVSRMPYLIFPMEVEEDDDEQAVEFGIDLRRTLWWVEGWLSLKAAAYVLKHWEDRRQTVLEDLQVLNARTMAVKTWDERGRPTSFEQKSGTQRVIYPAEQMLYFRTFDPFDDVREGVAAGTVGAQPGRLIRNANNWATAFFENGAIPAVLLTTEGTVPLQEKNRIQDLWNKVLKGVQRAFGTVVLEKGLTPTVIGPPIDDLAMPELEKSQKEQILAAYLLPPGLGEAKTNRAERDALKAEAYEECYIPECETWIEPVLNDQLFNPLGLRVSFQYAQIEVLQVKELEKAEASSFLVTGVMKPAYEANAVSLDEYRAWIGKIGEMSEMPPLDENFEPEERTPPQLQPFTGEEEPDAGGGDEDEPTPIDERVENRMPKAVGPPGAQTGADPKASAPPRWGCLKVSLPS